MLSFLSKFRHSQEMRESKDEILIGELVRAMARMQCPAIGFQADTGMQSIRFKPLNDPVFHSLIITVDRKTGGLNFTGQYTPVGNPSTIVFLDFAKAS